MYFIKYGTDKFGDDDTGGFDDSGAGGDFSAHRGFNFPTEQMGKGGAEFYRRVGNSDSVCDSGGGDVWKFIFLGDCRVRAVQAVLDTKNFYVSAGVYTGNGIVGGGGEENSKIRDYAFGGWSGGGGFSLL